MNPASLITQNNAKTKDFKSEMVWSLFLAKFMKYDTINLLLVKLEVLMFILLAGGLLVIVVAVIVAVVSSVSAAVAASEDIED